MCSQRNLNNGLHYVKSDQNNICDIQQVAKPGHDDDVGQSSFLFL